MPLVGDQSKPITDIAADLRNIDTEIAENEFCPALKKKRVALLQDLLDRTRSELVLSTRELRRYRDECTACVRCSSPMD